MFEVEYTVLPSEPSLAFKVQYLIEIIEKELSEVCKVVKVGASLICAPNENVLVLVYTRFNESRQLSAYLKLQSYNAIQIVEIISKLSTALRRNGYVITLATSSNTLL